MTIREAIEELKNFKGNIILAFPQLVGHASIKVKIQHDEALKLISKFKYGFSDERPEIKASDDTFYITFKRKSKNAKSKKLN